MPSPIRRLVAGVATLRPDDPALVAALGLSSRLEAELHLVHVAAGFAASGTHEEVLREVAESVAPGAMRTGRVHCRVLTGLRVLLDRRGHSDRPSAMTAGCERHCVSRRPA